MEQRAQMRQTCLITLKTGLLWLGNCRLQLTYFPTPALTSGGSGTRRDSPGKHAGLPSTVLRCPSEMQALSSESL